MKRAALVLASLGLAACPAYLNIGEWEEVAEGTTGSTSTASTTSSAASSSGGTDAGTGGADGGIDAGPTCGPSDSGSTVWSHRYGDQADQPANAVAVDANGNVIVTGSFLGSLDFGCGAHTAVGSGRLFLAKLDPSGTCLWSKAFGTAGALGIAVDPMGNIFVTGTFQGMLDFGSFNLTSTTDAMYVAKLDPGGVPVWAAAASSTGAGGVSHGTGVAVDAQGDVAVVGYFEGSIAFGGNTFTTPGGGGTIVAKLDPSGAAMWGKSFDGHSDGNGVAVDGMGSVVVTGTFATTIDFGCGPLTSVGESNPFVAKLSPKGACTWSKTFPGATSWGTGVAVDPGENVVATGYFDPDGPIDLGAGPIPTNGAYGVFLVELEPNGAYKWGKAFDGTGFSFSDAVAVDKEGGVFITGHAGGAIDFGGGNLPNTGGDNLLLAGFTAGGDYLWAKSFGKPLQLGPAAIAVDPFFHVIVAGGFPNTLDFGCGPLVSAGDRDVFVAALVR